MVDCYDDEYFVGLWGHKNTQQHICVRSRILFVVTFDNCPLLWVSKIQTWIALSTIHSEYVVLSNSVRALLPLKSITKEVIDNLVIDSEKLKFLSISTVYDENNGSIVLSLSTRTTLTSKHIAIKYHWFRENIGKEFVIQNIE